MLVSGLHGAETWQDGELRTREEPAGLAALRTVLPPMLPPGVWLEDKRLSLVLHTRRAAQPEQALAELNRFVPELVAEHGLEAHPGKLVIEIRIPRLSKATALDSLLAGTRADRRPRCSPGTTSATCPPCGRYGSGPSGPAGRR